MFLYSVFKVAAAPMAAACNRIISCFLSPVIHPVVEKNSAIIFDDAAPNLCLYLVWLNQGKF